MSEQKLQPLQELKVLAKTIYSGQIPSTWKKYIVPPTMDITQWIADLRKRLEQFQKLMNTQEWQKKGVWLGGLLFPEAFMTATRQYVAHNKHAS